MPLKISVKVDCTQLGILSFKSDQDQWVRGGISPNFCSASQEEDAIGPSYFRKAFVTNTLGKNIHHFGQYSC